MDDYDWFDEAYEILENDRVKHSSLLSTHGKPISNNLGEGDFISVVGKEHGQILGADKIDAPLVFFEEEFPMISLD